MKKRVMMLLGAVSLVIGGVLVPPEVVSANEGSDVIVQEETEEVITLEDEDPGSEAETGKWMKSGTRWWYLQSDNTYPAGIIKEIGGVYYAFDAQGWMVTGWYNDGVNWYYFDNSGAMCKGWIKSKGLWYYLNSSDGIMISGTMKEIGEKTYLFNKSGAMLTGWQKDGGNWYYFADSGAMCKGWLKSKGLWYYLNPSDGIMVADTLKAVGEKTYMFNKSGAMLTGWQKRDGFWNYFEANGAMKTGWLNLDSKWYYLDLSTGIMLSDIIQDIGEKTYCFKTSGEMVTGLYEKKVKVVDSETGNAHTITRTYYFEKNGAMKKGWVEINDKWSYFDLSTGIRYEGDVYSIEGTNYAFDDDGIMVTGWYNRKRAVCDPDTGKTYYVTDKYYFNSQGMPQTGWLTEGNNKYWINKDGWAVANGEYPVDKGRTAYFDEDAKFVKFV